MPNYILLHQRGIFSLLSVVIDSLNDENECSFYKKGLRDLEPNIFFDITNLDT